jgi:uncharacterized protein (DUF433 family)
MAVCANSRPWAWCLDMPCTVDVDPSKATCLCKQVSTGVELIERKLLDAPPTPDSQDVAKHGLARYAWRVKIQLVVSDPSIMMGKPVIAGTRITVESILERLAAGESIADVIASHPRLTEAAIRDALAFAAQALRADVTYPIAS